ncbi:PocR ligand-binding domain-containing protein [Carboxylicivirga sp. RSCT41]|uniref:PocR ligand-binding domain-containing protein n=1 Tax=Carboxylicivirga agarovorans TaxID=3417570 RepID=UPI003D329BBD
MLKSILNINHLQSLFESFNKLSGVPISLLLPDGEVMLNNNGSYIGAGWQRACTDFHRKCNISNANCQISDAYLSQKMIEGKGYAIYQCLNGLVDVAVPVRYKDQLIANLFTGQFFFKKPSLEFFKQNAKRFGFAEEDYLEAISEIEVFSKEKVETIISFLKAIANIICGQLSDKESIEQSRKKENVANQLTNDALKRESIISSTILSIDDYVYSLDDKDCFEDYIGPFKVGLFGETINELRRKHYSQIVDDDLLDKFKDALDKHRTQEGAVEFMFSRNKEVYHVTITKRRRQHGLPDGSTMLIKEITESIETVEKLKVVVEQSPVSVVITNKDGNIEYANRYFFNITGYGPDEVIGRSPGMLKSGQVEASVYRDLWSTIKSGRIWEGELINKKKDGTIFYEEAKISPVFIDDRIEFFVGIKRDITEEKKVRESLLNYKNNLESLVVRRTKQLIESDYKYKEIVEHLTGVIWEIDLNGMIRYISPTVSRYSDLIDKDLIGKPISSLFDKELHCKLYELIGNYSGTPAEFNDLEVFLTKGETKTFLKSAGKPIFDDNMLIGIRGISIDCTQEKERNKEIMEAIWNAEEKQKSFISMELHDSVGASLSAASIYLNLVQKQNLHNDLIAKVDRIIKDTAQEVRSIARQIRPPQLERLGLIGGLNNIKQLYDDSGQINVNIYSSLFVEDLPSKLELAAYRIITELISNSLKHGNASQADIYLFVVDSNLFILFEDNGNGKIDIEDTSFAKGMGIANIHNRVKAFEGICNFYPVENQGLTVGIEMKTGP